MFGFNKKAFLVRSTILSTLMGVTSLICISMTNKECKVRPELLMLIVVSLCFIILVLKQVNAVVVVTISMIHMQKCVFLML